MDTVYRSKNWADQVHAEFSQLSDGMLKIIPRSTVSILQVFKKVIFLDTVERGNFERWGNFEQLLKKHLTLSWSFNFLTVVRTSRAETSAKESKL